MKYSAKCPTCHHRTNIIFLMLELTPFYFSCRKCKNKIYVKNVTLLIFFIFIIFLTFAIASFSYIFYKNLVQADNLVYFLIPTFIVILFEFVAALIACNKAKLVIKNTS